MSAAEGQERAMRKLVFIIHGNKSPENELAPIFFFKDGEQAMKRK